MMTVFRRVRWPVLDLVCAGGGGSDYATPRSLKFRSVSIGEQVNRATNAGMMGTDGDPTDARIDLVVLSGTRPIPKLEARRQEEVQTHVRYAHGSDSSGFRGLEPLGADAFRILQGLGAMAGIRTLLLAVHTVLGKL